MAMPMRPPSALTMVIVASSRREMQSHSTLPSSVRNNSARCAMANAGTLPIPMRSGSCCWKELIWRRDSDSSVVHACPDGGTNWRGSSQIGQRAGFCGEGANWVPQVTQMKAGMAPSRHEKRGAEKRRARICYGYLAEHAILSEPVKHALPRVLGGVLAVARPVVGDEAVRRTGVDDELKRLSGGLQRLFHILDLVQLDT